MLLTVDPEYPNLKRVANAARFLKSGNLLAYPTDTIYGIGSDPFQPKAVARLFEVTGRAPGKPASLLCADLRMVSQYASFSDQAFRIMKRVLPGPYTLILPARNAVPRGIHGKRKEIGIRVPDHPIVQALIAALGSPLLNVSARGRDGLYLSEPRDIEDFGGYRIEAVLDCGSIEARESTIIDWVDNEPVLVREGIGDPAAFFQ